MPDFSQLTERQKEVYDFIKDKIESRGYGPTVREIGDGFGIKSPNGVVCHLKALEKKGLIRRDWNQKRGVELVEKPEASRESAPSSNVRELPLFGYIIAFQDYLPFLGFADSPWVGLANFREMLIDSRFWAAVNNTLVIALLQVVLYFPAPIILALIIDSVTSSRVRRFVQSAVYLPHFISWVIIVSLFQQLFGGTGVIAIALRGLGIVA